MSLEEGSGVGCCGGGEAVMWRWVGAGVVVVAAPPRASMMRQRARYSSSEGWSRERLERLRFANGMVGS